jgi:death-on-curing protein
LADKAAALMHSIARNHPLTDGNKRLAWSATRAFLLLNGCDVTYAVDDAESLVVGIATGTFDVPAIATWIEERLVESAD